MMKTKWIHVAAFLLTSTLLLTSCNEKESKIQGNTQLLNSLEESEQALLYKSDVEDKIAPSLGHVTRGDLAVETSVKVSFYYPNQEQIVYEEPKLTSEVVELFVSNNDLVEKGDRIASIQYHIDEIELLQLKLTLSRKEEFFKEKKKEREEEIQKVKLNMDSEKDNEIKKGLKSNYDSLKNSYDMFLSEELDKINSLKDELKSYDEKKDLSYMYAPITGIINQIMPLRPGDILNPNQVIGTIYDTSLAYLSIDDEKGLARYNMEVDLVVTNKGNTKDSPVEYYKGVIITGSNLVGERLKQKIALIELLDGDIEDLKDKTIKATGKLKHMKDVLLVDKRTVEFDKKVPYVMEYKDGKAYKRNFISPGFDPYNYMIFKGLDEGMEVILDN